MRVQAELRRVGAETGLEAGKVEAALCASQALPNPMAAVLPVAFAQNRLCCGWKEDGASESAWRVCRAAEDPKGALLALILQRTKAAEGAQMVSIDSPVATPGRTPTGRPLPTRHRRRLLQILAATKVRLEPACAPAYHAPESSSRHVLETAEPCS